jgi:hypothetical protein
LYAQILIFIDRVTVLKSVSAVSVKSSAFIVDPPITGLFYFNI